VAPSLKSAGLFQRASSLMPGGVNSPVRMFNPYPFFTKKARGSKLHDVDGNKYIDYCMGYGAILFGHNHPPILEAVKGQLDSGTIFGTPTEAEVRLAELLTDSVPCAEMVRLSNSGAEATMHAIRLARGYTGRRKLVKFDGCYHGAHDSVLVKAGSGAASFGVPTSLGVPEETAKNTLVLPYNNVQALHQAFEKEGHAMAAIIVEPIIGNMGVILPSEGYLQELRKEANRTGALLIFDEIITGFRIGLGGAQEYYGVKPDLATFGKVMGGGFPISAIVGKRKIMEAFSPIGGVYAAGTFSGNPVSVAAAIAILTELERERSRLYRNLQKITAELTGNIVELFAGTKIQAHVNSIASMFTIFFTRKPVIDSETALSSDRSIFNKFHRALMKRGVFFPPSQFETCFVSASHSEEDLQNTMESVDSALKEL
jgi:glutamate-1-semialdehyde 2,1-aminomutase